MPEMYETTDFYTCAVLISCGFEVKQIENKQGNTKKFFFEDTGPLRETILKYMNGALDGNLRTFKNAINATKDMIHSN